MKLSLTVNIGNYQNITFESNDLPTIIDCKKELKTSLEHFDDPIMFDFAKKWLTEG